MVATAIQEERVKRKRALVAVIAGVTALALAACGSSGEAADTTTSSESSQSQESSDTAAPSSDADAAAETDAKKTGLVVGVSNTLAGNGWRETMICAVKAEAVVSGQVDKVIVVSKNGGPTDQIQDLQNLISQGVDILVVNPSDPEKLNGVIEEAKAQGITVVAVDSAVTTPDAYVVTNDQVAWGELGMKWLAEQIDGKGDVLYMRGIQGVQADTDRDEGVKAALKDYPDIKLKEVWTGWDYTKGGEIAVQEFTAKQYDGVWTTGTDYTVSNAIKTAGRDFVPVVGQDTNEWAKLLLDGRPGAVVTNPAVIGGAGLTVALQAINGENPEQTTKITPQVWDLADNKSALEASYFADQDQMMSSATSIEGLTHFNNDQLFSCKGPGE